MKVRPATENDVTDLAYIHNEGWKAAYSDLVKNDALKIPTLEDRTKQWQEWIHIEDSETIIALDDNNSAIGLVSYGKLKTPPPGSSPIRPLYSAEIYSLYLLPDYYRQGIGTTLMHEAFQGLKRMKHNSMCLWTLERNKKSRAFYEAKGGQRIGKYMIEIGTETVKELCYGWRDIDILIKG